MYHISFTHLSVEGRQLRNTEIQFCFSSLNWLFPQWTECSTKQDSVASCYSWRFCVWHKVGTSSASVGRSVELHKWVSWEPTEGKPSSAWGQRGQGTPPGRCSRREISASWNSMPSPGGLKMCVWVEVRNVWAPEEILWVSSLSRAQSPWDGNVMQMLACGWWPAQRRGLGLASLELPPNLLQGHLFVWNDGLGRCRTNWKKEVLSSTFHGSFVSSELFSAGVVYISSELKELLCSRRYRKHRPVWEGHWPCARPTCLCGWMAWVFRDSRGGWNVVLRPKVGFAPHMWLITKLYILIVTKKGKASVGRKIKALFAPTAQAVTTVYSWYVYPSRCAVCVQIRPFVGRLFKKQKWDHTILSCPAARLF